MATETICKFNQSGFCKYQSHCRKQHFMEICTNTQCSMVTCLYRHPRPCRYFNNSGRCKFEESCAYLHKKDDDLSDFRKDQEKEIEKLRNEVEELTKQVLELRIILKKISNSPNLTNPLDFQANLVKSPFLSSRSSITMVESNHSNNLLANPRLVIPQVDGSLNSLPPAIPTFSHEDQNTPKKPSDLSLQCETCHENFETEDQFNDHDRAHQYCCDECFICFTTQVIADLHELKEHPNTHYANTYIPQSTKVIFASQPENQPTR